MSDAQSIALQLSAAGAVFAAFGWWMLERAQSLVPQRVLVRVKPERTRQRTR